MTILYKHTECGSMLFANCPETGLLHKTPKKEYMINGEYIDYPDTNPKCCCCIEKQYLEFEIATLESK